MKRLIKYALTFALLIIVTLIACLVIASQFIDRPDLFAKIFVSMFVLLVLDIIFLITNEIMN